MSVSGVSSTNSSYQAANPYAQIKQNFQNLSSALQSGNLSAAQQAFAQLQQDNPNIGQSSSQGSQSSNPVGQAMQSLASSLQSGDLSGAQQAFAQLQQSAQAGKGHGHHHHHQGSGYQAQDVNSTSQVQQNTYNNQGTILSGSTNTNDGNTAVTSTVNIMS